LHLVILFKSMPCENEIINKNPGSNPRPGKNKMCQN
jgi:hypothetical protein